MNHVRTLLLNRHGTPAAAWDYPGEELVDPQFRRKAVPAYLEPALRALFGSDPDRLCQNYRLRECLALLHATELETHVLRQDPRISYDPREGREFFDQVFGITVGQSPAQLRDINGLGLHFQGSHEADDGLGRTQLEWRLEILPESQAQVVRVTPPRKTETHALSLAGGLSAAIPLSGCGLLVRLRSPEEGWVWRIQSRARPSRDFGQVLADVAAALGPGGIARLLEGSGEPWATWQGLWSSETQFAYKYGALLLAIAERLDEAPQARD